MRPVLMILHQSTVRTVDEREALAALSPDEVVAQRQIVVLDTRPYADAISSGHWDDVHNEVRRIAQIVRAFWETNPMGRVIHVGLGEVPCMLALGAYIGDEHRMKVLDLHRDTGQWNWPEEALTRAFVADGLPGERIEHTGIAVIRVEAARSVEGVEFVVGSDRLADVVVRPVATSETDYGKVRSEADVEEVRRRVGEAHAAIMSARPGVHTLHVFVSGPPSVCIAVGEEMRIRNGPAVQTYRYRSTAENSGQNSAILISPEAIESAQRELSEEEARRVAEIRQTVWPRALRAVQSYAAGKRREYSSGSPRWFDVLQPQEAIAGAEPIPQLPPVWEVVQPNDGVDTEPYSGEYGHDLTNRLWKLSDGLLLGLEKSADGDADRTEALIRLFLFHEYLHYYHSLTKYSAEEVGKFANCLERLDYGADLYALLHQVDLKVRVGELDPDDPASVLEVLIDQLDLIVRSYWAFEPAGTLDRWQVRRLRRYLNWYWRKAQLQRINKDVRLAMRVLARQPTIEVAGLQHQVSGRRVFVVLNRRDPTTEFAIGLVMENEKMLRVTDSATSQLTTLLDAFRSRDHVAIGVLMQRIFEEARERGGALPT